jgi:hypothetical protein
MMMMMIIIQRMWNRNKSDMVRRYIYNIGTILTSLKDKEYFLLSDVGSTYLTVVLLCGPFAELSVLIHSHSSLCFRTKFFFRVRD